MTLLDLILVLILVVFMCFGWWMGIIHMVGGVVGTIAGAFIASHYVDAVVNFLSKNLEPTITLRIGVFFVIFFIITRIFAVIIHIIEGILGMVPLLPTQSLNRLAGALLGILEGALILGLTLIFALQNPLTVKTAEKILVSPVARISMDISKVFWPLVPKYWKKVQGIQEQIEAKLPNLPL